MMTRTNGMNDSIIGQTRSQRDGLLQSRLTENMGGPDLAVKTLCAEETWGLEVGGGKEGGGTKQ